MKSLVITSHLNLNIFLELEDKDVLMPEDKNGNTIIPKAQEDDLPVPVDE